MADVESTGPCRRFDYDVFISYRSSMFPDKPVAEALQRVLETFPIPGPLKNNVVSPRRWRSRLRVFRDVTDLNASSDLTEALKEKLRQSRYLIVICTPNIPTSPYCAEEIRYFQEYHGTERVLPLLVQGEPDDSFPDTLVSLQPIEAPSEDSCGVSDTTTEPLAADVRVPSTDDILKKLKGKGVPKAHQARFKLLAPILGCKTPDDLIRRDRARFRRQVATFATVLLFLVLSFTVPLYRLSIGANASAIMSGLGGNQEFPSRTEYDALADLANATKSVRMEFVDQLLTSPKNAERLRPRFPYIVHALVGLDGQMRERLRLVLLKRGKDPSTKKPAINIACAELGVLLDMNDGDFDLMIATNYVAAMEKKTDWIALSDLGSALGSLGERLPPEQAAAGAQRIVNAMEYTPDPHADGHRFNEPR